MTRIAFIGLGTMGYAMAGHLQKHHRVTVFNRSQERAQRWCDERGGQSAATPRDAAVGADFVFTCVGNDDDVRSVVLGEKGALAGMKAGACLIDHTTASPALARELVALAAGRGVDFMDAPVSGGAEGARNASLTIMCGATEATFERASPLLASYGKSLTLIGGVGAGQAAKMINQICVVGILQSLAEGLTLAEKVGLDTARVIDAISQGAASSWQMQHRWQSMLAGDFAPRFANKWMAKDLAICLDEAERHQIDLPLTRLISGFYEEMLARGDGELDITSLMQRLS